LIEAIEREGIMLVLSRNAGERIVIDPDGLNIEVVCLGRQGGQYRIGVLAPPEVLVMRAELLGPPPKPAAR
jgi:carbon storage regulator CsrA